MALKDKIDFSEQIDVFIDPEFHDKVSELSDTAQHDILEKILKAIDYFPMEMLYTQKIYGVVREDDIFYEIEYMYEEGEIPFMIDINFVDVDKYLDEMLLKNTIDYYFSENKD